MSIIMISLIIFILSLKSCLVLVPNMKRMTDKIQFLGRTTNKTKKNIHLQTKRFRAEATTPLHYETEQEQPNVLKKINLNYSVTIKE